MVLFWNLGKGKVVAICMLYPLIAILVFQARENDLYFLLEMHGFKI